MKAVDKESSSYDLHKLAARSAESDRRYGQAGF